LPVAWNKKGSPRHGPYCRYLGFALRLINVVGREWLALLSEEQRRTAFNVFFPFQYSEGIVAVLLALGGGISNSSDAFVVKHLAGLTQDWFQGGGIRALLNASDVLDSILHGEEGSAASAAQMLASLPDRISNRLDGRFFPTACLSPFPSMGATWRCESCAAGAIR
jgi:hypothetical protein